MDKVGLSQTMKRLTVWLETRIQPESLVRRQFQGAPFGDAYVTIDPECQTPFASGNSNRVHLCGAEAGMDGDSINHLIDLFAAEGVRRFFVWLSPGPDIDRARGWIENSGLSRIRHVGYPTLCRERHPPAHFNTDLEIRQVGPEEIAAAREQLGAEMLWAGYARSAGHEGFFHYMAFDGRRPVAFAALGVFEDIGYLTAAGTAEADRKRGAQQALIARRIARAEQAGCSIEVSETLHMLEHSLRNLRRAGFEEAYEKEVYEWNGLSQMRHA
jgi:hypothetical protein